MDDKEVKYKMTISRLTVDKLGVKLYDKVSAVIAELVANSYDADATEVIIKAPMGIYLSKKSKNGSIIDKGYAIEVQDNGIGMTPDEVNDFYLVVGKERRKDEKRGDLSEKFKRKVMGRKGIGKLAPFGVCRKIEVLTSGGDLVSGNNPEGKNTKGYMTAHLILDRNGILSESDEPYLPNIGELDGTISETKGTLVRLSVFDYRMVPDLGVFDRQLAQRFGVISSDWKIKIEDTTKRNDDKDYERTVGEFVIEKLSKTRILLNPPLIDEKTGKKELPAAVDDEGATINEIKSGFYYEDTPYPITGWAAYSKDPYKDDLMAGIRIYCRGKIAAQTNIFNMKAGFTGEYDIRSYLVGEIHADWLDETEDLIRTDRQDILWSHDLGQELETWGQNLVKVIGKITREPRRKKAWEFFKEKSGIEEKVATAFPVPDQKDIRDNSIEIAKMFARVGREEELGDSEHIESIVRLSLLLGPHMTLDEKLTEAGDGTDSVISVMSAILKIARLAELSSFGKIAEDRIRVLKKVEILKDDPKTPESDFQKLITEAPWLINPQWNPITENRTFSTLKKEFVKFYSSETGCEIVLDDFGDPGKQCDFVMLNQDKVIQIIEIKKPDHSLTNQEMDRINNYKDNMTKFLASEGNQSFSKIVLGYHITLICDGINLSGIYKTAFDGLKTEGLLEHINWRSFLLNTQKAHEDFLSEADRQIKLSSHIDE